MCMVSGITAAGVLTALKVVGTIAAVAGTAMSTVSAIQQGKAQEEQYRYQARVAQENAEIAENNAATERQQGIEEARLQRIKAAQVIGSQKTSMAANGVDVTQGTALDVIEDTAAMGELDALQTRYNYERKALAYEAEANNFQNQGNLDMLAGQNAYSAGLMNGLASGMEGITKTADVASKWYGTGSAGSTGSNKAQNKITWGKLASGMKIGTSGNKVYASTASGLA